MIETNPFVLFLDYTRLTRIIERRRKEGKIIDKFVLDAYEDIKQQLKTQLKITKPI
jgi:hypothetical protein